MSYPIAKKKYGPYDTPFAITDLPKEEWDSVQQYCNVDIYDDWSYYLYYNDSEDATYVFDKETELLYYIEGFEASPASLWGAGCGRELLILSTSHKIEPDFKKSKWGMMDTKGNWRIPPIYDNFGDGWLEGGVIAAKRNGKYGFIDSNNNVLLDFQFDEINYDRQWMGHPSYEQVRRDEKYGVVGPFGKLIVPCNFTDIEINEKEAIILAIDGNRNRWRWTVLGGLKAVQGD